jgi:SAM-dependent methyltransferase
VAYEDIDATAIPYTASFDLVVFKSMLGALRSPEQQARAIAEMHRALRPGGALLFAENLIGSPVHRHAHRTPQWRYVRLAEMHTWLRLFERVEIHTTGVTSTGLDDVLDHLVPASWRYVVYGVAWKAEDAQVLE